jgi:hypothetical protein
MHFLPVNYVSADVQGIIDQHRYTSGSKPGSEITRTYVSFVIIFVITFAHFSGGISPSLLSTRFQEVLLLKIKGPLLRIERILRLARNLFARVINFYCNPLVLRPLCDCTATRRLGQGLSSRILQFLRYFAPEIKYFLSF